MKPIEKLHPLFENYSSGILRDKLNELINAVNQREEPEETSGEILIKNAFKMYIHDNLFVIQSLMGYGYHWERFKKKEAEKLLSEIKRLVESMD